mmetsp:Transcript_28656/g.43740  ORF Transcript_28656/g.43740 Transcript_28656/m.43740 type:complete len:471 (+) Transcript_28656:172-1584(+)
MLFTTNNKRSRCNAPRLLLLLLLFQQMITLKLSMNHQFRTTNDGFGLKLASTVTSTGNNIFSANNDDQQIYPVNGPREVRVLAIVFPQYHQDPLNDKLWGEGFTDWNSVKTAPAKNRLGYGVPRPLSWEEGGLGYYDYTSFPVRKRQAQLARKHGIDGFVFHHYWFHDPAIGGASLKGPLEALLKDGEPNIPFLFNWCAMKWTYTWTAKTISNDTGHVVQKQFFPEFDKRNNPTPEGLKQLREHYNWLSQFFHLDNYIKVHGKPVFMMYQKKVAVANVLRQFNKFAKEDGFPGLYFMVGLTRPQEHLQSYVDVEEYKKSITRKRVIEIYDSTVMYPNPSEWNENRTLQVPQQCKNGNLTRVDEVAGIMTSFDNTPRRGVEDARIWSPAKPEVTIQRFGESLQAALTYEYCCFPQDKDDKEDRFIIINAMNEWAEAMALEPSDVYQYQFLEQVGKSKQQASIKCASFHAKA